MDTKKYSRLTPGVLPGRQTAPHPQDVSQLATVLSVSASGVKFTLTATPGYEYGPAPWCLGPYATADLAIAGGFHPVAGDSALVVFAGSGIGSPVVLAWWR